MVRPSPHGGRNLKAPSSPCRATCATCTSSCSLPIASPIAKNRLQWEELNASAERLRSNLYAIRKRASRHPKAALRTPLASMVRAWARCEPKTAAGSKSRLPYTSPMLAGNRALGRLIKWVSALTAAVEALRDHNRDCPTRTLLTHTLALRDGRVEVATLNPLCSQWCRRCKSLTDRIVRYMRRRHRSRAPNAARTASSASSPSSAAMSVGRAPSAASACTSDAMRAACARG